MASASGDSESTSLNSDDEEINIFLKVMKTVAFKVKRSERIKDVKAKFHYKVGISGKIQSLFFNGNELKDSQTLIDYAIQKNSTLHLFLQGAAFGMKVFVKLPPDQRTIVLEADTRGSVQNIKAMIQDKEGISQNCFTLIYSGKKLEDSRTLAAYNIQNEATMQVVLNPSDTMIIYVETQCPQTMKLEVKVLYTIHDIKSIVECMSGIPIYQQKLIYAGKQLVDCQTLAYYNITEESVIQMLPLVFQIFVKTWSGKTITLEVKSSNTVGDVMAKINQKLGVSTLRQGLQFAGRQLEEGKSLGSYMIQKDSTICQSVIRPLHTLFVIIVKTSIGKTIILEVDEFTTVGDVKKKINQEHGVSIYQQRLVICGRWLKEGKSLGSYPFIQNYSILYLARKDSSWHMK